MNLKSLSLIFIIIVFASSCIRENDQTVPDIPQTTRTVVKAQDIPDIIGLLQAKLDLPSGIDQFSTAAGSDDGNQSLKINWDEILQLVDSTGRETYTFSIEDSDGTFTTFYNLILQLNADRQAYQPFLLKYEMAEEFVPIYLNTRSLASFSGKVSKIVLNAVPNTNRRGVAAMPSEINIDGTVCPGGSINFTGGGGTIGGGGWSTSPPGPGLEDPDPVTTVECTTYINYTEWTNADGTLITKTFGSFDVECTEVDGSSADDLGCGSISGEISILGPRFEENIDDTELKECFRKLIADLKKLDKGMGWVIHKFAGTTPSYNWKMEHKELSGEKNASTSSKYDFGNQHVLTLFDYNGFKKASELSLIRTLLHESVHAYLVANYSLDRSDFIDNYYQLLEDYSTSEFGNFNDTQHAEFVRNWVNQIAYSLQEFGELRGLNQSSQFYVDLAWGGLTHITQRDSNGKIMYDINGKAIKKEAEWFKLAYPKASDRIRVLNIIRIEQTGQDSNGYEKSQKSKKAGC